MVRSDVWRPGKRKGFAGPALIDTHIWIWYLDGAENLLGAQAVQMLRACVRGAGLIVSDISIWEIGTKAAKGKLTLLPSLEAWLDAATRRPGLVFEPLTRHLLLASTQLPRVHGDPADRILIAAAQRLHLPLITADRTIVEYALAEGGLSVCEVES